MKLPAQASLLLAFAAATAAHAATYTWNPADGNFSNPASWSGPAPAPTGSRTDQLVFPAPADQTSTGYTVTLDTPGPFTLNTLSVGANNPGNGTLIYPDLNAIVTINPTANAFLLFTGPSPTITDYPLTDPTTTPPPYAGLTINAPITSTTNLTLRGRSIMLNAPLSFTNTSNLLIEGNVNLNSDIAPAGLNQLTVSNASFSHFGLAYFGWNFNATGDTTRAFGAGPITVDGAEFELGANFGADTAPHSFTLTNALTIKNQSILAGYGFNSSPSSDPSTYTTLFSGPISLQGQLYTYAFSNLVFAGNITIDQSATATREIDDPGPIGTVAVSGNIVDDPDPTHTAHNPLRLTGASGSYTYDNTTFTIAGTANTYSTGTEIAFGHVTVAPNSSLGMGNVTIDEGANLHLTAPSNIAPGKTVNVQQNGTLAISFDQNPAPLISANSTGILALDTTFTTPLDMSTLGNGVMSLSTTIGAAYAATSLRPGTDHVYRFTGGGYYPTLTLLNSVLADYNNIPSSAQLAGVTVAAPNSYSGGSTILGHVYATAPGALGTGNITIGSPPLYNNAGGNLHLTIPNLYAANITVDVFGTLSAEGPNGAVPVTTTAPIFHAGSFLTLGDGTSTNFNRWPDTMPLNLSTTTLQLNGLGTTHEIIGPLSFAGLSTLIIQNPRSGNGDAPPIPNVTTLSTPSLAHADHAVLLLELPNAGINDTGGNITTFHIAASPPVVNGMLPPYIQTRPYGDGWNGPVSFLTATAGDVIPTSYVPLPTNGGTGTEIVDISIPTVPSIITPSLQNALNELASVTIPADTSIYALRTSTNLANPAGSTVTLHILSGGLIVVPPFSGEDTLISPNIDFQNAEAYINTTGFTFGGNTIELAGHVTATHGITKFGTGTAFFSNPNNTLAGPITLYEGGLNFASLPEPNSTDPIRMSTGTSLQFGDAVLSRPIHLTSDTLNFGLTATISATAPTVTLAGPITGDTNVNIYAPTRLNIAYPINFAAGLNLIAPTIHLASHLTARWVAFNGSLTGAGVVSGTESGAIGENGNLSPGDNPGDLATLTFDMPYCQFQDGVSADLDLSPSGLSDRLLFTGSLEIYAYDPTNTAGLLPTVLNLHFLSPPTGQIYTLLTAASLTGTFSDVTGLPNNYTLTYTPTAILLLPTAVPEPTTLFLLALAPLFARRRRNAL